MNISKLSELISVISFCERFNKNKKPNAIKHKADYIMVFEKIRNYDIVRKVVYFIFEHSDINVINTN